MSRPTVACYCGTPPAMYAALFADGPDATQRIASFRRQHSGPGHLEETPTRDWHGKEVALKRQLRQLGRDVT